jgi:hypothetical protein
MIRTTLLLTCACLAATAAVTTACILACNDIGCAGGFEWTAAPEGGEPVSPGAYAFEITLEDDVFTVDCTVAETYADSSCAEPVHVTGTIDYIVNLSVQQVDPDHWDPMDPIESFHLYAADTTGSDATGSYSETRGPTEVSIVVTLDEAPLTSVDYELEYVRNDDYRGDPACGFCDETQSRKHQW